jgi:hypothetical protein
MRRVLALPGIGNLVKIMRADFIGLRIQNPESRIQTVF